MEITEKQKMWLKTRGGRKACDVIESKGKLCISNRFEGQEVLSEIPNDSKIDMYLNKSGYVIDRHR